MTEAFKICGSCRRRWHTAEEFLRDPELRLLGMQTAPHHEDVNLLVFEHRCGTSISVLSRRLRGLLPEAGPDAPAARLVGTAECRGHCLRLGDLERCDAPCRNARDRELMRMVLRIQSESAAVVEAAPERP